MSDSAEFELTIYRDGVPPETKDFEVPIMTSQLVAQAPWTKLTVKNFTDDVGLDFSNPDGGDHFSGPNGDITGLDPSKDVYVIATKVE
jgi:hypothetical protein